MTGWATCMAVREGDASLIVFDQPDRLLSLNQRLHWSTDRRIARSWRHAALVAALRFGPPSKRSHPASFVLLELPVPDRRRRDPANYAKIQKAVVDGLVDAGVWPDDTPEFVTTIEPTLVVDTDRARLVRVRLIPRTAQFPGVAPEIPSANVDLTERNTP